MIVCQKFIIICNQLSVPSLLREGGGDLNFMNIRLNTVLGWALLLYVFLLPWQARYIIADYSLAIPVYGDLSVYILDGLFILLVLTWFIWLVRQKTKRKSWAEVSDAKKALALSVLIFISYVSLSVLWSSYSLPSLVVWDRLLQMVLLILMIRSLRVSLKELLFTVLLSGLVQSFWAIVQFFLQAIPASTLLGMAHQDASRLGASVIEFQGQRWLRAYGSFPHPNILGGWLFVSTTIASAWYLSLYKGFAAYRGKWSSLSKDMITSWRWQVVASLSAFIFCLLGLLISFSRGAWLAYAAGFAVLVIVMLIAAKKREHLVILVGAVKLVIIGMLLLSALTLLIGPLWTDRVFGHARTNMVSGMERVALLQQSKNVISLHPVLGGGVGSYLPQVMRLYPGQEIFEYQPVHNVWLLLYAEFGLIGGLIFVGWSFAIISGARIMVTKKPQRIEIYLGYALFISTGIAFCFDHFWYSLPVGMMLVGILLAAYKPNDNP